MYINKNVNQYLFVLAVGSTLSIWKYLCYTNIVLYIFPLIYAC